MLFYIDSGVLLYIKNLKIISDLSSYKWFQFTMHGTLLAGIWFDFDLTTLSGTVSMYKLGVGYYWINLA